MDDKTYWFLTLSNSFANGQETLFKLKLSQTTMKLYQTLIANIINCNRCNKMSHMQCHFQSSLALMHMIYMTLLMM